MQTKQIIKGNYQDCKNYKHKTVQHVFNFKQSQNQELKLIMHKDNNIIEGSNIFYKLNNKAGNKTLKKYYRHYCSLAAIMKVEFLFF